VKCQAITQPSSPYELYGVKGGPCKRNATYTDGSRFYCTQHAKDFATVLKKATNKIRDGLYPIEARKRANFAPAQNPLSPNSEGDA
jgi:hypothetical protein